MSAPKMTHAENMAALKGCGLGIALMPAILYVSAVTGRDAWNALLVPFVAGLPTIGILQAWALRVAYRGVTGFSQPSHLQDDRKTKPLWALHSLVWACLNYGIVHLAIWLMHRRPA